MLQNYNKYKLLKVFLYNPNESFRLRELSRMSEISPPSVMAYLKEFEKENLIEKYQKRGIPFYKAVSYSDKLITYKKISIIYELYESGLIAELWEKLAPEAIILYGSFFKGEANEDSDVDIFVIGDAKGFKGLNLKIYEKKLGREIHLIIDEVKNISNELKNNLINGVVLKGYFKAI